MSESIVVRPARESDYAFILDAWRRSFEGAPAVQGAKDDHYRAEMGAVIARLVRASTVRVACDAEDDDTILGFVVVDEPGATLHYAYVRREFRQLGIVPRLIGETAIRAYTFRTLAGERRLKLKERGLWFKPRFTIGGS